MVRSGIADGIATITLARPDKANALTGDMLRSLTESFDAAAQHDNLRAVVLTGEGRVFSAGADLNEAREGLAVSSEWERLSSRIASMPCLTIAALNGSVAGGAFGMILACDLRIAVPEARFFYPVMRLGFRPQPSDPARMRALIGPARTKMILMAGQKIAAAEALIWGLIDGVVEAHTLMERAGELARDTLVAAPEHIADIKRMIGCNGLT